MNRPLLAFLSTVVLASSWAAFAPAPAIQPGQLLDAHATLRDRCSACHVLGSGVRSARCEECHARALIGVEHADGTALATPRPGIASLHAGLTALECSACHAEHAGRLGRAPAARFTHELLGAELRSDCARCHAQVKPADALHTDAGEQCQACHTTQAWKPATYEHSRWFRFDKDHPPRCDTCHEPGSGFKTYTCAQCHPWSRIAHEHDELGGRDLKNCVECHRSGDKHDAEHGGGSREGGGGREREDDDDDH
ncbi:MAG: class III cytochrome C family protein [Planctomycetes bacterium]|nr:class III cytochrome C family protein [Planctomycetota bacterium]